MASTTKISIAGTVGLPASYGGFETLVENLVTYSSLRDSHFDLTIYCSKPAYNVQAEAYETARLRYVPLKANGAQSIPYDIWSIIDAVVRGADKILLLGTSGAFILPLLRPFLRTKFIVNIDGMEWRREKWSGIARLVLKASEHCAVRFSDVVIADNAAIGEYLRDRYGIDSELIAYGGDHALAAEADPAAAASLPKSYALALCRIEPENNVHMILEAFAELDRPLVFIGNWDKSGYGVALKARYKDHPNIIIHDPVYEPHALRAIRDRAIMYIHGHSAGGTNPSLVEMMHFDIPIFAHGCSFNRHTTEGKARYFTSAKELAEGVHVLTPHEAVHVGADMGEIARRRYTWDQIGKSYFDLLRSC